MWMEPNKIKWYEIKTYDNRTETPMNTFFTLKSNKLRSFLNILAVASLFEPCFNCFILFISFTLLKILSGCFPVLFTFSISPPPGQFSVGRKWAYVFLFMLWGHTLAVTRPDISLEESIFSREVWHKYFILSVTQQPTRHHLNFKFQLKIILQSQYFLSLFGSHEGSKIIFQFIK